jgi:hypothetical protein
VTIDSLLFAAYNHAQARACKTPIIGEAKETINARRAWIIMNTFWLKIAGVAVGVVAIIIVASNFLSEEVDKALEPETGFSDQVEKDRRFLEKPEEVEVPTEQQPPAEVVKPVDDPPRLPPNRPVVQEQKIPDVLYFKPLGEIEKIEAERLINAAVPGRSVGRLQVGYKQLMVDPCREIIRRWPDSFYAFQAKRMLADLPERFQDRYRVTEQERDLSRFFKPREGTVPMQFKEQN